MKLTPQQTAELVGLVSQKTGKARVTITGTSMHPSLRAGMVVDVEPFAGMPRMGEIAVFRSSRGLTAHRVVARGMSFGHEATAIVTAGDAFPHNVEIVRSEDLVGRVGAVWSGAEPGAHRIDGPFHAFAGHTFARTRRQRALWRRVRETLGIVFSAPGRKMPPPAFAAFVRATEAFENGRFGDGIAALRSVPFASTIEIVKRHKASGVVFRWLEDATAHGIDVPKDLVDAFRRVRWTTALQSGRVLGAVADVRDRFEAASIPHIFLKGGARLASASPDADLHFSGDVDVIVPPEHVEAALAALRAGGYTERFPQWRRKRYRALHHRAPLQSPSVDVPIEVHVSLTTRGWVSQPFGFADLVPHSLFVDGPAGRVRVLNRVASAVHLAYHGRDFRTWRDLVFLSRMLRDFDFCERGEFDLYTTAEKRDGIRLRSAVAAADAISCMGADPAKPLRRYLTWAKRSEDLPRRIARNVILEVVLGRYLPYEVRFDHNRSVATCLRGWARSIVLLPAVSRYTRT